MENDRRTIVGGRSRGNRLLKDYPRGMEILLKKAKVDDDFRDILLLDPFAAAECVELTLSQQEMNILNSTPRSVLETMITNTPVAKQHANTFRTAKTAAVLLLLLGTTAVIPGGGATEGAEALAESTDEQREIAVERMSAVQEALEAYREDRGSYPTTIEWNEAQNPLDSYLETSVVYDPWQRKFHYEAVTEEGEVVNYLLECLGPDDSWDGDNILCPIDTDMHSF